MLPGQNSFLHTGNTVKHKTQTKEERERKGEEGRAERGREKKTDVATDTFPHSFPPGLIPSLLAHIEMDSKQGLAGFVWLCLPGKGSRELRVGQTCVFEGFRFCPALPIPCLCSAPASSAFPKQSAPSSELLFLSRADRDKKICSHLLGTGCRSAWSCHRHSAPPASGSRALVLIHSSHFSLLSQQDAAPGGRCELAWRERSWEGAEIEEKEVERGVAGAPGPHPAAPGLFPQNNARLALRSSMNSLLIPEIWGFSASQGGTREGLKRAQGARAVKKSLPTLGSQPFPQGKIGELSPSHCPSRNTGTWMI